MNHIKLLSQFFLSIFITTVLLACGKKQDTTEQKNNQPKVVATINIIADIAQNIAGERLHIQSLLPTGGDPHIYEPTPRDAQRIAQADLILANGLTLEGWMSELIENSGTKAKTIICSDGVNALRSEKFKHSTDPHAWMTAANGIKYAENIKNALIVLDPVGKAEYEKNCKAYQQKLQEMDTYIEATITNIPEKQRVLITSHDAFEYYGIRYHLRLESILGTSTDADAQTADIIRLGKVIEETKVPAVFIESTINPKMLQQIAADHHLKIGGKLFADSLGDEKSGADTYLKMLKANADCIANALKTQQ